MTIIACPHCGGSIDTESVLDDDAVFVALRGGSCLCIPKHGRSGCRDYGGLEDIDVYSGFRLILPPMTHLPLIRCVLRGGGWGNYHFLRSRCKTSRSRASRDDSCGFRLVLPQ
jgi:formylglycine-generating enzyme required for sulfatase activity